MGLSSKKLWIVKSNELLTNRMNNACSSTEIDKSKSITYVLLHQVNFLEDRTTQTNLVLMQLNIIIQVYLVLKAM